MACARELLAHAYQLLQVHLLPARRLILHLARSRGSRRGSRAASARAASAHWCTHRWHRGCLLGVPLLRIVLLRIVLLLRFRAGAFVGEVLKGGAAGETRTEVLRVRFDERGRPHARACGAPVALVARPEGVAVPDDLVARDVVQDASERVSIHGDEVRRVLIRPHAEEPPRALVLVPRALDDLPVQARDPGVASLDGKIVECTWDKDEGAWRFLRVRSDKDAPNFVTVYRHTLGSILDDITSDEIVGHRDALGSRDERDRRAARARVRAPALVEAHAQHLGARLARRAALEDLADEGARAEAQQQHDAQQHDAQERDSEEAATMPPVSAPVSGGGASGGGAASSAASSRSRQMEDEPPRRQQMDLEELIRVREELSCARHRGRRRPAA